jgi:hypothetical protein
MDFANGKRNGEQVIGGLAVFEANESGDSFLECADLSALWSARLVAPKKKRRLVAALQIRLLVSEAQPQKKLINLHGKPQTLTPTLSQGRGRIRSVQRQSRDGKRDCHLPSC